MVSQFNRQLFRALQPVQIQRPGRSGGFEAGLIKRSGDSWEVAKPLSFHISLWAKLPTWSVAIRSINQPLFWQAELPISGFPLVGDNPKRSFQRKMVGFVRFQAGVGVQRSAFVLTVLFNCDGENLFGT